MRPTLLEGDRLLVDRWTYRHRRPRTGELVLLAAPDGSSLVKRVARAPAGTAPEEVWVLGDDPAHSADSRELGAFPVGRVVGRVVFCYWPPSRVGRPGAPSPAGATAAAPPGR